MKKVLKVPLLVVLITLLATSCDWTKNHFWEFKQVEQEPEVESAETIEVKEFSIAEAVEQRRAEIEYRKIDSIYYTMPEIIFIAVSKDIESDVQENVVYHYLNNKEYYDGLLTGVKKHKQFDPDSIPKKAKTDVSNLMI